jgi:Set1/Ash2 histone methyltransferase complex subunit ASH2
MIALFFKNNKLICSMDKVVVGTKRKKPSSKTTKVKNFQKPSKKITPHIDKKPLSGVYLSNDFKSKSLLISEDGLTATGHKGYTSVLSNYPIIEGAYYFEVKILNHKTPLPFPNVTPHIRIGFATCEFKSELPLGCDAKSYAIRDKDGEKMENGYNSKYAKNFNRGDIIGCLIFLKPPKPKFLEKNEDDRNVGSKALFCINGENFGIAFENLREGFYYVGVSLYMHAKVKVNFGPKFDFPPNLDGMDNEIQNFKPFSSLGEEPSRYKEIKIFN